MRMQAAVLEGPGQPFVVQDLDLQPPGPGEVRVAVRAAGVCHSDWHLVTGATGHAFPVVPGHEGAGIVETVGEGVTGLKPGDHVALNWAPSCGVCALCRVGRPSLCRTYVGPIWAGTMLDGTTRLTRRGEPVYHFSALACFAEAAVVPAMCCVPLPKAIPFPIAAVIGCAVATGVGAVVNTARIPAGASVAVVGAGGVGLSAVLGARLVGAGLVVVVDRPEKEALAREFGADQFVPTGSEAADHVRMMSGGLGVDFVVEAVGLPSLQEQALDMVRPGGTLVLAGLSAVGSETRFSGARIAREEKAIVGCYYGTCDAHRDFPRLADLYVRGRLPLDRLVTRTYPLSAINEAYNDLLAGRNARGVLTMGP